MPSEHPSTAARQHPSTLLDKVWDAHVVRVLDDGRSLLYIDRHLVHEVTSPQAFEGLRLAGRKVRRPDLTFATVDHNVPTAGRDRPIADPLARAQVDALRSNAPAFGVPLFDFNSGRQGIVHVIGPELGLTLPGTTIVCGDSHTSTHGAFGALAFGIGTSEVEHVLATQCLVQQKPKAMRVRFTGTLMAGVTAKDVALALIARLGFSGGTGYALELGGPLVASFSMEERMTLCNMSIEAGARSALVAPDHTTYPISRVVRTRPRAPTGTPRSRTGASCAATRARGLTPRSPSTSARWRPSSRGARGPTCRCPSPGTCPIPGRRLRRAMPGQWSAPSPTWA